MNTKLINIRYVDGKRIETQEIEHTKSDDLFTLASLQRRYETVCNLITEQPEGYDAARLEQDKSDLEKEIAIYEGYINGFAAEEVQA